MMRKLLSLHYRSAVRTLCLLACSLTSAACSGEAASDRAALPEGVAEDSDRDRGSVEFVSCEIGTSRECYRTLGEHGGVTSCYMGIETCLGDSGWGPCTEGVVTTIETAQQQSVGQSLLALTSTQECVDNPCNPSCQVFEEDPVEVGEDFTFELTTDFDWETGTLGGMPKGLVDKGLKEPCSTGFDCQYNSQCVAPVSNECVHDKCQAGEALKNDCDPCVEMVCAQNPECCLFDSGAVDDGCVSDEPQPACCEGETEFNGRCYRFISDTQSWTDSRSDCQAFGTDWDLVSIASDEENAFVAGLAEADDTWIGITEGNDIGSNSKWRWSSGDPSGFWNESSRGGIYAVFDWSEPNSGELCARIRDDAQWWGKDCSTWYAAMCEGPMLCETDTDAVPAADPEAACAHDPCQSGAALASTCDACVQAVCAADASCCDDAWTDDCVALVADECDAQCECADGEEYYGGHCYYVETGGMPWSDARASCQARGDDWDLVSIADSSENDFIDGITASNDTWIGLTEGNGIGESGQWKWSNGDPGGTWWEDSRWGMYDNFNSGEPDSGEVCSRIRNDGEWYGRDCGQSYDSICESPTATLSELTPAAAVADVGAEADAATCVEGTDVGAPSVAPEWSAECAALVDSVCDVRCEAGDTNAPAGACKPWYPGETDETCPGIDLAVGVPCDDNIPVCNHGNTEAPAGVRIVHFPANAQQYPKCQPDQTHPQMFECFTDAPIAPGECINVTGCPKLIGNREIMVNPEGEAYVEECSCQDNWSLYSGGECGPPVCSGGTNEATAVERPVDIIVGIDNSVSMQGEIVAVQDRINEDFAQIIQNSGIDYRVIMVSRYGNVHITNYDGGGPYDSAYSVCVGEPLSSLTCPATSLDSTPTLANNSPFFFHHSTDIGSRDMFCKLYDSFSASDPINSRSDWNPVAPDGWGAFLREDALKVFVAITDDGPGTNTDGTNGMCPSATGFVDGQTGAETFDEAIRTLAPEQFGSYDSADPDKGRNYVWHSIVGMGGTPNTNPVALGPDEDIEGQCCTGAGVNATCPNSSFIDADDAPRNGLAYQYLSKMTGGLRYPICYNDSFDEIFNEIAKATIDGARVSCSFQVQNTDNANISGATVVFKEDDTADPVEFTRVPNVSACTEGGWYQPDPDDPTLLELCPAACDVVQGAPGGQLSMEVPCAGNGYEPYTFDEVYAGACSFDEGVQWGYLSTMVTAPGDSSVELYVRTAETEAGLAAADLVKVADISAANGNTDCYSPDVSGCPMDLYALLGGVPQAMYPFIEIEATLNPTSDGEQMPRITDWELTFSCPDIN